MDYPRLTLRESNIESAICSRRLQLLSSRVKKTLKYSIFRKKIISKKKKKAAEIKVPVLKPVQFRTVYESNYDRVRIWKGRGVCMDPRHGFSISSQAA